MSKRQEELSKLFDRKYGETKIDSSAGSNLSPRQREIEDLFNKMSIRNGVSSFDDLNNYFENSTKAVNSARDYYNNGTAGRRKASELEKIKENALKLDDFTEKKDSSTSVMAVGGYMTREGSARSEYLKKQGYNSLKELEDAIQKAQTSDKYDRNFGSEYETELEDAYSGGQSALKFIEENKDSFDDYDKLHAQLSDYLNGIKDLTDAMKGVRDYYGQWDNEDVYKNGYGVLKTAEKTLESAWESIKGGYTGASAAMSASNQGSLSIGQSAQAARENKTDEEALEEINEQRRQRADKKMEQAAKYFDNAGSAEMLATWQKNAMGKLLVDVGSQIPALAGDIALSAAGSLVGMPQAGLVSMGVRAYGQGAYDARQKGLSWEKSELAGIKSAAIEVVTEKLLGGATKFAYGKGWIDNTLDAGIEKALSRMGASNTLTKGIGYLVDAGEEGVEEMISDVLNPVADRILSLQNENGKYLNDFDISDMFYDGMVGFVLGLAGTSVNAASSSVKSIRENKEFKKLGSKYVDELLEKSAKYNPESKIAKTINEKNSKGKEISGREIKQLTTETNEAIEKADIQKIEQSTKGQLEKYGEKVSVPELAAAIAKQTAGQDISKAEAQLIEDSVYGQRVVKELDPINIRSGEYTSDWVQNIGTELVNAEQYNKPEEENNPLPLQDAPVEEQTPREIKEPLPAMNASEQEQFVRDRYAEQVKNGTFTEETVQGMIEELHDGIPLESILNRVDNNIKEIENERNDSSDGSMGRELGGSSAEQSSAVQESAGRSESPKRAADRGTKEVRRNSEKANARQVSSKSLGLSNGTDTAKLTVVEKNKLSKTSQMISTVSGAKSVTVVKGSLEVADESGTVHRVSGVKTGDGRIIVRGDHPLYTTEQLLLHETEHMYESDDMLEEMRATVIETIGEPALNELCMQYAVKWGGLYTEEDMYGIASMKEKEVYADALAGISRANTRGTKKITSAVRKVFYKHTGLDVDALLADEQSTVTEAKQNEAQSAAAEPKAQAPPQYSIDEDLPINLQLVLNGDFDSKRNELHIGTTSNFLTDQIGAEALELYMPANKAYSAMATEGQAIRDGKPVGGKNNYHGLSVDGLIEILNASENPIAAFAATPNESGKRENRIVLVTDVKVDGGLGVVIEEMDTKALSNDELKKANKAITVYSKRNARSAIQEAIADGRILYLDEKRSQAHLAGMKGSNYPTAARKADFSNNIRTFWDNVKWKKSGKVEMSFDSSIKTEPEWKKKLREYNTEDSYSVDDTVTTEEEAQHRRDFQKIVTGESLRKLGERKTKLEGVIEGYKRIDELADYQTKKLAQLEGDLAAVNSEIEKKTKKAEERKTERKTAAEVAASAVDSLHIRRTTAQSRKVLRQQIYDQYGIVSGRKDIGALVDAFADKWISQGKISKADIDGFEDALMQSGAIQVESANEYARDVRSWMSNGQISVPQYVREEFSDDWNSIKKRAFANRIYLSIDTDHAGIDQWTKELAGSFGEGVFDDTVDLKTQLEKIIDIAEDGRDEHLTVYQMAEHMRKTQGKDIADAYLEDMHEQLISTLKSFAQSAKIEMETVKRSVYQKVRDDTLRREKAERAANERAQREFQQKTLKQLQWLKRNQNFMGNDYQKEAQRILGDIDTIAVSAANEMNWSEKHQATWKDLGRMYKWAKENDPNFLPSKDIENIIARVEGTHLDELSASDLENIYKAAVALRTAFYNRNNVIGDRFNRAFKDMYASAVEELKAAKKPNDTTAVTQKIWDSQLNPIHRINRMFGWKENSAGFQIFGRGLEQGERATKRYVEQATQILDPWLEEHKDWVSKADGQGKDAIWYELEVPELLKFGEGNKPIFGSTAKVYMTPMQKIYMYLESKNYDNLRHMVGGRTFADKELYSKGEREEAFAKGTTISIAPESVKKIVSNLTQTELELANILEKQYFNGYAKTEINRVSNVLYGYDRAMSDNYAPIYTNRNYNKTEPGVYQDGTAEGVGHMKTRVQGAKNPTYNVSALEAFRKHISQTSRFVGMSIPAQNAETLLNWRSDGTSMQDEITHNWSSKELDSLKNVMTELQSPTYLEQSEFASAIGKLMSNYIGGVFGSNITVAAKVLASKPTAAIVLGNQYYPKPAQVKNVDTKLISKYTSELDVRIRGYGTPELAAMTLSQSKYMKWVQEHKASKLILGGGLLQAADIHVVKTMWPWAENKVRAESPELEIGTQEEIDSGNSPFYKKVAKVYENAIGDTQSMYDIMHRSNLLRDTNEITRSFTIFHTDSLQAMNLIRLRAGQLEAAKQDVKKAESDETRTAAEAKIKTAAKELGRCIGNVVLMNTVVTLFDIIRDLFRHREDKYANDEGEVSFWSFVESTMLQIAENTSGLIIGADALTEVLASWITGDKYYDHEVIAVKTVNDLLDLMTDTKDALAEFVSGLSDVIKNDGDVWEYIVNDGDARGAIKTAAEKIAHFFGGIPVENVEKLLVNAIGWVLPQVSAAYSGIWETQNKSDLSNSRSLETDIKNLYRTKTDISDETAEELARLYEAGYKNAVISDTPSSVTIKDEDGEASEKIELNEAQRQAYNAAAGKALKHIEAVISSEEYKTADDKDKAKMLSRLNQYAKDVAAAAVTDTKLTGYAANVPDWLDDGMSWGQIASGNTIDNNNASKYIAAGVEPKTARDIVETIDAIETEDNKSPSTVQKVKAVAYMTISEANKEAALSAALSEKACARYMAARKCGVSSVDYADFLEILDRVDANGGNPSQDEFKEAVRRANLNRSAAAAIWATYWKSSSPW